jgi:hypothetical protein
MSGSRVVKGKALAPRMLGQSSDSVPQVNFTE